MPKYRVFSSRVIGREAFPASFEHQHILEAVVDFPGTPDELIIVARQEGVRAPVVERVDGE